MKASDIIGSEALGDEVIPYMVEVELVNDSFLRVKESLTRIGIPGKPNDGSDFPTLHQTCHILYKRGRYYICHFKTLFILDGKANTMIVSADIARQNTIINLLQDWNLVKVVKPDMIDDLTCSLKTLKVVKFADIDDWRLVSRYDVGSNMRKEAA